MYESIYENILPDLETPSVLIDLEKTKKNIVRMQDICDAASVLLRPHIKTHKMIPFAHMQLEAGAAGITCAKISEAEVMAAGGCEDIFIAYPLVGDFRLKRAGILAEKLKRFILAVDSIEGAQALGAAAARDGKEFEVRLEIDSGAGRTGLRRQNRRDTIEKIVNTKGLRLTGLYTFKSLSSNHGTETIENLKAAEEEVFYLEEAAELLREAGIKNPEISGGSSPTGQWVAESGKVTEIRPGTYIFNDYMLWKEGVAEPEDIAAFVVVMVVSTPCEEYAVIDGGTKVFPTDITIGQPPFYYEGYAKVVGNGDLRLLRMNEEHGMLYSASGHTGLKVGQKLLLYPGHVCTTINLRSEVTVLENGHIKKLPVDARGMSV